MTGRRRAAALIVVALAAVGVTACSSGSSNADRPTGSSTSTTTTGAVTPLEQWVAQWRGVLATQYGPAQQAFLDAVQGAKVVDVQSAAQTLMTANEALLDAVRAAGSPPSAAGDAAARLETALATERALIEEIQRVCTGKNDECQPAVARYADNNSKEIVPAFVALKV